MGMQTHLYGIKPPDETWRRMKDVLDACKRAKVTPPSQVLAFFDGDEINPNGVSRHLASLGVGSRTEAVTIIKEDGIEGFLVNLERLPPDIKMLRFVNSY